LKDFRIVLVREKYLTFTEMSTMVTLTDVLDLVKSVNEQQEAMKNDRS